MQEFDFGGRKKTGLRCFNKLQQIRIYVIHPTISKFFLNNLYMIQLACSHFTLGRVLKVSKLAIVNPCALRTLEGAPVSIFHVGSAKFNKVVHDDHLQRRWMEALEV